MADDCICKQHSGLVQHEKAIDKKVFSICNNVTDAHKRLDSIEKEIVDMPTFRWTIGILITVLVSVIGLNAVVLGKMDSKLSRVDKAVAVIEARTENIK